MKARVEALARSSRTAHRRALYRVRSVIERFAQLVGQPTGIVWVQRCNATVMIGAELNDPAMRDDLPSQRPNLNVGDDAGVALAHELLPSLNRHPTVAVHILAVRSELAILLAALDAAHPVITVRGRASAVLDHLPHVARVVPE